MRECLKCGGSALKDYEWGCEHDFGDREFDQPIWNASRVPGETFFQTKSPYGGTLEYPTKEGLIALWKEKRRLQLWCDAHAEDQPVSNPTPKGSPVSMKLIEFEAADRSTGWVNLRTLAEAEGHASSNRIDVDEVGEPASKEPDPLMRKLMSRAEKQGGPDDAAVANHVGSTVVSNPAPPGSMFHGMLVSVDGEMRRVSVGVDVEDKYGPYAGYSEELAEQSELILDPACWCVGDEIISSAKHATSRRWRVLASANEHGYLQAKLIAHKGVSIDGPQFDVYLPSDLTHLYRVKRGQSEVRVPATPGLIHLWVTADGREVRCYASGTAFAVETRSGTSIASREVAQQQLESLGATHAQGASLQCVFGDKRG